MLVNEGRPIPAIAWLLQAKVQQTCGVNMYHLKDTAEELVTDSQDRAILPSLADGLMQEGLLKPAVLSGLDGLTDVAGSYPLLHTLGNRSRSPCDV